MSRKRGCDSITLILMRLSRDRVRELLLLGGLCGFFFFFRLSGIGLLGPDEPRYAQVAREMLARHNWVTPYLYGHTWLEKPILLYWAEMLSFRLFGIVDWAARVPPAAMATAMSFGVFLFVRHIRPAARLDAAMMVASGALVLGFARAAATDMLLAAPFTLGLLAWFAWYQSEFEAAEDGVSRLLHSRLLLSFFYAMIAVASLAKGPVAPGLAALVVIAFCLLRRTPRAILRTLDPLGIVVFLAVALPWYVAIQRETPEFFHVFFLQHNLARFSSNLYRHRQPFWYYLPVALVGTLPWTVWLLHGLNDAWRGLRQRIVPDEGEPGYAFEIFLAVWGLLPIVFFSLSRSKLPGYILPGIPALLMLGATAIHRRAGWEEPPRRVSILLHATLLGALAAALIVAPRVIFHIHLTALVYAAAAAAFAVVFLLVALPLMRLGWPMLRFVTLLPMILLVGLVLRGLAPTVDATSSSRPVAQLLSALDEPGTRPLATFGVSRNMALGLAFYLNRPVAPYEGLEVSPAVYELPAAVPSAEHILILRMGAMPALHELIGQRAVIYLGEDRNARVEIYRIGAATALP